jgi:hypothetical protein
MQGTQSQSRSIEDVVKLIEEGKLLLPEFQRDFKWPIEKSETLFDSIFQDLFIGSLIISKPKFDLACKKFDERPRGSRGIRRPEPKLITKKEFEDSDIYTLLDGQQRITSMYRALKGIDEVYLVFKAVDELIGEGLFDITSARVIGPYYSVITGFDSAKPREKTFYIKISDLYRACVFHYREQKIESEFLESRFTEGTYSDQEKEVLTEIAHQIFKYFATDILKKTNLLSVQLLDMDIEKFCLYFERSNSQGLNLSFTDIITAKVYTEFRLGQQIEKAKIDHKNEFTDNHVDGLVRYINFLANGEVTKTSILQELRGIHFKDYWHVCVDDLVKVQQWLVDQNWVYSTSSLPYRTMLLPILSFYQNIKHKDFSQATNEQLSQLRLWFYSGLMDYRYGGARHGSTNVVLKKDLDVMRNLARGQNIPREFWEEIRLDYSFDELKRLDSNTNAKGIGINYYLYYLNQFLNIENYAKVNYKNSPVDVHHFFPSSYIKKNLKLEDYDVSDCFLNKIQINKISNIKIADKSPSRYLNEMKFSNTKLDESLRSHSITCFKELVMGDMDFKFMEFLSLRYQEIALKLDVLKSELEAYQEAK